MKLECLKRFDLGMPLGFVRSANVDLGGRQGMLFLYSDGCGADPGEELFQYKGLKPVRVAVFEMDGTRLWEKTLPDGVIAGPWFVPAVPFDMDGDGIDEIYYVNNTGAPFSFMHRKLERLDALTGETTGVWPWPQNTFNERLSLCYRFYIVAGYAHGEPVLVTCQGTYGNMYLQGWNNDMEKRWDIAIGADEPGPRASHMTPVMDINGDGVDELFWGERLISLDDGHEVLDYAPEYNGHSDVITPLMDYRTGDIYIYTCREGGEAPGHQRVYTFRAEGGVAWSAVDDIGHMHTGWGANILDGYGKVCMAMRQHFVPDDSGFNHEVDGIFYWDAFTGKPVDFHPVERGDKIYPIDLNGDGYHEFIVGWEGEHSGDVLDRRGQVIDHLGGDIIRMGKMIGRDGEQVMRVGEDGRSVEIWGDAEARDGDIMKRRYSLPYLNFMQKLMATGYNSVGSEASCGL